MAVQDAIEGLPIGIVERSAGRTIGEGEFALLTSLHWITTELHSNQEFCRSTEYGERILPGAILVGIATGLWIGGQRRRLGDQGINFVAALGLNNVRFRGPFFPGDTLWMESVINGARPSQSRPNMAVVELHHKGVNQRGEVVIEMDHQALIERRAPSQ